jgi:hypothetical protein
MLEKCHPFEWENTRFNPKQSHPPILATRDNWYKTMKYHLLDSNGFQFIYTLRGRVYWISQALASHTTPDWKLHVSVHPDDIPIAWNILVELFTECKCEIGMKATTTSETFCSSGQRGREFTIYIYVYDPRLQAGIMFEHNEATGVDSYLGDNLPGGYEPIENEIVNIGKTFLLA